MFEVKRGIDKRPAKVLLYGTGGIGKTTFASTIPNSLILDLEQGANNIDCARVVVTEADELRESFIWFAKQTEFKTLVIDSWTTAERIITNSLLKEHGWPNLEKPGFGKGYEILKSELQKKILKSLRLPNSSRKECNHHSSCENQNFR